MITDWKALHGSHFAGQRVLVTGGAGFIGSHLCEALSSLAAEVIVLDDLSGGSRSNIDGFAGVKFVEGSILDRDAVKGCVSGCGYVFHEAALGSVPGSIDQPRKYQDVNVTGTLNVLEAAADAKVRRLVFAASSSAYGDSPTLPKVESMPPSPRSPYAANKVACEALLQAWSAGYGLDTCNLRYFNIFGPRQNANSAYAAVIAAFASSLLQGKRPVIFGDGEQSRDFTFVENAVHANLLAARHPKPLEGAVLNVACGVRTTVNTLAESMAAMLGRSDLTPEHRPERAGDVKHSLAELSAIREVLGYEPIVDFDAGLAKTVQWYRATS